MERREFLRNSGLLSTALWAETTPLYRNLKPAQLSRDTDRILVVVELSGGCDGLNTIVPYRNPDYYKARPNLAIPAQKVLKITDRFGFHPSLSAFKELYDNGHMAIVQGVGYPNPNRCHQRSMKIWHRGRLEEQASTDGWLAKYLDSEKNSREIQAAFVGTKVSGPLNCSIKSKSRNVVHSEHWIESFKNKIGYRKNTEYPDSYFGANLRTIADIVSADCGVKIFYTSISGFDTHIKQVEAGDKTKGIHSELLTTVSSGIKAFLKDMKSMGKEKQTLIMAYSEFGRRLNENATLGTDHGTAGPMFFVGGKVRPGIYGEPPSLEKDQLDRVKDLVYKTDFRSAYSTVLSKWMGADPVSIMGGSLTLLRFV